MNPRVAWGLACLGAMLWVLFSPAVVRGPIEAQFKATHSYLTASPTGELRCILREDSGGSDKQRFWYVAALMLPGQILLVMSVAKLLSHNHAIRAR